MSRRFVHVVVDNVIRCHCKYTLHSINASSFFYPERPSRYPATIEDDLLPQPAMSFHCPCNPLEYSGSMDFMSLGRDRKDILGVDHVGRAILYDTAFPAVRTMPTLHAPKSFPISVTAGNTLYVMNSRLGPPQHHTFEALLHGRLPDSASNGWFWRSLPPPPYVHDSAYHAEDEVDDDGEVHQPYEITAYTAVGGYSQIWISTAGVGTYAFDAMSGTWSKPGEWSLPFIGCAEFVPEHNLWFGFSSEDNQFCACDLTVTGEEQPSLRKVWELDLRPPQDWIPNTKSYLVPLGSGKFCIVNLFRRSEELFSKAGYRYDKTERFAVFTGVEVENVDGIGLRMIKHKSKHYCLDEDKLLDQVF
ncbi:unnamed protein product [Alopecurus aequalis]